MNLIQFIMTHKDAKETVERHLPIWENISKEIYFVSPVDSMMSREINKYSELGVGLAEHHGEKSAQRIISIFETALKIPDWTHILLMEYDSFAISLPKEVMPDDCGISAAVYSQNKPIKFRGKFYLHYPMLFTREGFWKTYECLSRVKSNDRLFSDRFIGRAVEYAGISVKNLLANKKAYSKNTILPEHYPKLRDAVKGGSLFYHGCKTQEVLDIILNNK